MSKPRRKQQARKPPLAPLHPAEVEALNRAFYAGEPADFLRRRLRSLITIAASSDAEERAEARAHRYGKLELTTPSIATEPADEKGRARYLAIETEMLLHHASETLLRTFLAHRGRPDVPWLETAKLRGLGEFKKEIRKLAHGEETERLRVEVGEVWTGRNEAPDADRDRWREAVDRIADYLSFVAQLLLERAGSYNAAKHGLAVQPGDSSIKLMGVDGVEASGPGLAYLSENLSDGKRFTVVTNRWLDIERDLTLVYVIAQLLDGLWSVARIRYLGWPIPEGGLAVGPAVALSEVIEASQTDVQRESGIRLEAMAFPPAMFSPPGSGADALQPEAPGPGPSEA